jgi:hypothetical protein
MTNRRQFLQIVGTCAGGLAMAPLMRALAAEPRASSEYFIFIHQIGGWDVALWSDPRNERKGLIRPAHTDVLHTAGLKLWRDAPLDGANKTFQIVTRAGFPFGPGIGPSLLEMTDRLCLLNGVVTSTVDHVDAQYYATTGRHLSGAQPVEGSIEVRMASEFGNGSLIPAMSVGNYPSAFKGPRLAPSAKPVRVTELGHVAPSLKRADVYNSAADRSAVSKLLAEEADDLAGRAVYPDTFESLRLQYQALPQLASRDMLSLFDTTALRAKYPEFGYDGPHQGSQAIYAAFAVEAIRRGVVRSFAFPMNSCDHHGRSYQNQGLLLQETFEMVAQLVRALDRTHVAGSSDRLSDHVHILVTSDFSRSPFINFRQGRDHWPNNSALIISPRFKGNYRYGSTDGEQLLPKQSGTFEGGTRAMNGADVLATFLSAFRIDPRKYMQDGEVVRELLR